MKLAIVIQRCGKDVYAGAEQLTYNLGLKFSTIFETEILTTCAKDASSWENHYSEGIETIDKLKIRRFRVEKKRDPRFVTLSQYLETNSDDLDKGIEFIEASGPVCTKLVDYIKKNKDNYDLFIFVGYLYWQTFHGMSAVKEKSVLLPTAHNESWLHFKIFEKNFEMPMGYLFLTNAEKEFVHEKFGHKEKLFEIGGYGLNPEISQKNYKSSKIKLPKKYLLYVGRISAGKGSVILSNFLSRYLDTHESNLNLVLLGTVEQKIQNDNIIIFENLSDDEKFFVIQNCTIFVMPSSNESLNIACLEAMLFKKPVLMTGESPVLKDHCINGNCGLYYNNFEEFSECLDLLLNDKKLQEQLGLNGRKYVEEHYNWGDTLKKYDTFFQKCVNHNKF